ncbi:hypothetical protein GOZ96_04990 [Agrobacterium vitis]|uniref:Uncharacterized protein n=1 Tax=Agrobacterium vitis TaxID=373 RepID=A0A7J4WX20_AGRVI|nr:hypothetical protein [Agrobacterium vitis]KAA3518868.1 hypothetical protein DXT89_26730 [Agrobacterium vitis]MUZ95945.1 hypothetical protein [Agrobacterium vitis]
MTDLRSKIVDALRDRYDIRSPGDVAETVMRVVEQFAISVDPGSSAPPVVIALSARIAELEAALAKAERYMEFFEQNPGCELSSQEDDRDEGMEWVVHAVTDSRNDREWKLIGKAQTPTGAIDNAVTFLNKGKAE